MTKTKISILALVLAVALWAVTLLPKVMLLNEKILAVCTTETGYDMDCIKKKLTKEKKLKDLCDANPDIECQKMRDYCDESLEQGQECYLFNFPLY